MSPQVQWTARNPGQWDGEPWLPDPAGPVRPDKGLRFTAQPARDAGDGNEDVSLRRGSEWDAAMAVQDLATDCCLEEESMRQIF